MYSLLDVQTRKTRVVASIVALYLFAGETTKNNWHTPCLTVTACR